MSTRTGTDICEFAQHGVKYRSVCNMIYVYLLVYVCIQRGSKCEQLARAQTYVSLHHIGSYTTVFVIEHMYACEYMHVYKANVRALARAQTYVSSHNMGSYTKLSMIRYMYTNICQYMYTKRF